VSYSRALLTRWSRRDRLTVVVVAVTTAFLVGSTLLLAAAGAQTATIAGELDTTTTVTYEDSSAAANANATGDELVFPTVVLARNGSTHRFVGIPPNAAGEIADASVDWQRATIPSPNGTVQGPVAVQTQRRFETPNGTVSFTVQPHEANDSLFPSAWYVANASTIRSVGGTSAFVIHPGSGASGLLSVPQNGSAVLSALVFLFAGMRELLAVLLAATVGSAVLVVVVVYSVLRMTVRDRLQTIRVVRSTGGSARRVCGLFGLRAGLIVTLGVALGYAVGVILTNAVVNVAVYAGLPISLSPTVTPLALGVFAVILPVLILAGVVAGVMAARTAATRPPARLTAPRTVSNAPGVLSRVRSAVAPTLLDWRAIIPTTLTLAVFAVVVILITSVAGAVAPLSSPGEGTVAEADAPHVLNSRIDTSYASVLRSQGIAASPEILLTQTIDGEPFLALGANYTAFASVTNATVQRGRPPNASAEAIIGADLADTLGIGVGDSVTLGGSLSPAVARVTVVGTYSAPGVADDQLVLPLSMAHHLSIRPGVVQYIRTERTNFGRVAGTGPANRSMNSSIRVTGVSAPNVTEANQSFSVTIRLQNTKAANATRPVTVTAANATRTRSVALGPDQKRQLSVSMRVPTAGTHTLRVANYSRSIRVLPRDALWLPPELPHRAPPNATLFVPVVTPNEQPVPNATVTVGNATATTGDNGVAQIDLPDEPGAYTIVARKGDRPRATHNLSVSASAQRRLSARLTVTPKTGSVLERPEATVTVANPWNTTLTRDLTLASPVTTRRRNVTLEPGATATVGVTVFGGAEGRATPGTYTVRLLSDGNQIARTEYTVTGDERLFSALASTGQYSQGAGVGRAIRSVFGNIQLLFATMVVLAGLTTVGTTTATFAQVIHARRRTIGVYRATGAPPRRVLSAVLKDVCLISIPAAAIAIGVAVVAAHLLGRLGMLTIFGIQLSTATPTPILLGTAVGAFLLAVAGAVLATLPFLARPPTGLFTDSTATEPHRGTEGE
jgi:ABC-type lipoprotein release transport system permease subunit